MIVQTREGPDTPTPDPPHTHEQVEDVVENLCALTHLRDDLEAMGGKVLVQGTRGGGDSGGEEEEDYSRYNCGWVAGCCCVLSRLGWAGLGFF